MGAGFRVTNVKTPVLSTGKLVKHDNRFEAGPTGCNMSKGDRSVTLDVVKNSLWLDATASTTAEGARNADARLVAPLVDGLSEELLSRSSPTTPSFETARAPRGSSAGYLECSSPVEDVQKNGCASYGAQKHKCGAVYLREK